MSNSNRDRLSYTAKERLFGNIRRIETEVRSMPEFLQKAQVLRLVSAALSWESQIVETEK